MGDLPSWVLVLDTAAMIRNMHGTTRDEQPHQRRQHADQREGSRSVEQRPPDAGLSSGRARFVRVQQAHGVGPLGLKINKNATRTATVDHEQGSPATIVLTGKALVMGGGSGI